MRDDHGDDLDDVPYRGLEPYLIVAVVVALIASVLLGLALWPLR